MNTNGKAYGPANPHPLSRVRTELVLENKEGMNYSPGFNALLGSLDEAARGLVVRRLQFAMPSTATNLKEAQQNHVGWINGLKVG
jgi:hypothetical protein